MSFWFSANQGTQSTYEDDSLWVTVRDNAGTLLMKPPVYTPQTAMVYRNFHSPSDSIVALDNVWLQEILNLNAFAGQTVQIGFETQPGQSSPYIANSGRAGSQSHFGVDDVALWVADHLQLSAC